MKQLGNNKLYEFILSLVIKPCTFKWLFCIYGMCLFSAPL